MRQDNERLADVLRECMSRPSYRVTPGLLSKMSGVPKATIVNWLEGRVSRPRRWQDVIHVADALRLDASDTDQLLLAAGQATLTDLKARADGDDALLLDSWLGSARPIGSNLIHPSTPLLGRETETKAVVELIRRPDVRFVTLTGPAGVGKTRLAVQVAQTVRADFRHGVAFVPLASVPDWRRAIPAIGKALGLVEGDHDTVAFELRRALLDRSLLLLLDNVEHVAEALPSLAGILEEAPTVRVLSTSRAVLHVYGEHQFEVPPLPLPNGSADVDHLLGNPAVALFVMRARAVDPSFSLTAANAADIADIVAMLDGLPLSIELAAARCKLLTPRGLLARLGNRLGLLTWGARDRPERHQSLRATLDWSFDRLDPGAMALFTRLCVFPAGCTVDAAEAVADQESFEDEMVIDALMRLVDHSLMRKVAGRGGDWRFTMLDTIREYAAEHARRRGELHTGYARFVAHVVAYTAAAEREVTRRDQRTWLARLDDEHDNTLAALAWARENGEGVAMARIASALHLYWLSRGHLTEGRSWLRWALSSPALPPMVEARIRATAGLLARRQGDLDVADSELRSALRVAREHGDRQVEATARAGLGLVARDRGDLVQADQLLTVSLQQRRRDGDASVVAETLTDIGEVARARGNLVAAVEHQREALAGAERVGDLRTVARSLTGLGRVLGEQRRTDEAGQRLADALAIWLELDERGDAAECVDAMAAVAAQGGFWHHAVRLSGAADRLRMASGVRRSPADQLAHTRRLDQARAQLGDPAFERALREGTETALVDLV